MKVAVIINSLNIGGAEKLVADSFPFVRQKFPESELIVLKESKSFIFDSLKTKAIPVNFLTKASVYNPLIIFKLIPVLKRNEVVHFHLFPTLYFVVLASMLIKKKPYLIYTEHNTNNKRRDSKLFKWLDQHIYSRIDKIVSIADEVDVNIKTHLKHKMDNKIVCINNGVDLELIKNAKAYTKQELGFQEDDIILLQVSSFRLQKDQSTLLKALQKLPSKYKLLLAGDGELRMDNEKLSIELGVFDRVHFLGNRKDIPQLLKSVDIIVLSSHHEGLSLASIEAMASGNPFIASDVPGLREIVKGYGLVFEKGNTQDLVENILNLEQNPDLRHQVIVDCQQRAQDFSLQKMLTAYTSLYLQATKNN